MKGITRIVRESEAWLMPNVPDDVASRIIQRWKDGLAECGQLVLDVTQDNSLQFAPVHPHIMVGFSSVYVGKKKVKDDAYCKPIIESHQANKGKVKL